MSHRLFVVIFFALLFFSAAPSTQAAVFKCDDGSGGFSYRDHPCDGAGQPLEIMPAPAGGRTEVPVSLPAARAQSDKGKSSRTLKQTQQRDDRKEAAHKKKCDKLALRRQWADQDMQAVRAQPLRPQDKKLDNAQRKLRRLEEQYRLECGTTNGS